MQRRQQASTEATAEAGIKGQKQRQQHAGSSRYLE
jgi:hypothetical protein